MSDYTNVISYLFPFKTFVVLGKIIFIILCINKQMKNIVIGYIKNAIIDNTNEFVVILLHNILSIGIFIIVVKIFVLCRQYMKNTELEIENCGLIIFLVINKQMMLNIDIPNDKYDMYDIIYMLHLLIVV